MIDYLSPKQISVLKKAFTAFDVASEIILTNIYQTIEVMGSLSCLTDR